MSDTLRTGEELYNRSPGPLESQLAKEIINMIMHYRDNIILVGSPEATEDKIAMLITYYGNHIMRQFLFDHYDRPESMQFPIINQPTVLPAPMIEKKEPKKPTNKIIDDILDEE